MSSVGYVAAEFAPVVACARKAAILVLTDAVEKVADRPSEPSH
jgi:hypothetical protein